LVLAAVVASIVNPYTLVVNALEQTHRFIPVNLLRLIVYLAALGLLVPGLLPGAPGAALARLVLIAFPAWVYVRWTRELAGVGFYGLIPAYLAAFALGLGVFHGIRAALGPAHLPPTSSASAGCTRAWARISVMPSHFCRPAPSRTSFAPASAGPEPAGLP